MAKTAEKMPRLLLPCVFLALGGVSLLSFRQPAPAHPLASLAHPLASPTPQAEVGASATDGGDGDGEGDELLEHWGNPTYSREEWVQMEGAAAGFLLLGVLAWRKRSLRPAGSVHLTLVDVSRHSDQAAPKRKKAA